METLIIADLHAKNAEKDAVIASLRRELDTANLIIEAQDAAAVERRCVIQALRAQLDASRAARAEALAQLSRARDEQRRMPWKIGELVQNN